MEYDVALIKNKIFPKGIFGALFCFFIPKNIKANAPKSPNPIPTYLRQVIFSFKKTADSISNITGTSVITTELFIGV